MSYEVVEYEYDEDDGEFVDTPVGDFDKSELYSGIVQYCFTGVTFCEETGLMFDRDTLKWVSIPEDDEIWDDESFEFVPSENEFMSKIGNKKYAKLYLDNASGHKWKIGEPPKTTLRLTKLIKIKKLS